jgi:hypothetical protein
MLKIPTFLLGGLLILTGLAGYFLQDPGLSIKLTGPLAENAKLTLSDGNETHELNLVGVESSESNGERAFKIIWNLNTNHATNASQGNYAVDHGKDRYRKKSFWYASSKGETFDALMQDAENYNNAGNSNYEPVTVKWGKVDTNSSTIKFVYKNETGSSGPVTLQVSNWKNIDIEPKPKPNEKLEFKKSWTALIPGIIGLVLILLIMIADAKPSARKHVMHGAVLFGLLGFYEVAKRIIPAVSEMNWLKSEPNAIIQTSIVKPAAMLISAGILLIFIILCVVSFIQARKEMAAQAKKDAMSKKKAPEGKSEDKEESSGSKGSKRREGEKGKDAEKGSDIKDDSNKPKRPDDSGGPAKRFSKSPSKGLPDRKPVNSPGKKASFDLKSKKGFRTSEDTDDKKSGDEKSGDLGERKDSSKESEKDSPSFIRKESEETPEKKEDAPSPESSKESGETSDFSEKKSEEEKDGTTEDSKGSLGDSRSDSEPNKEDDTDSESRKESGEGADFSEKKPEDEKDESGEDAGVSYKKPDFGKSGDSDARKDSDEQSDKDAPSPEIKESEETPEKKEDGTDPDPKKESGESNVSSEDNPVEK